MTKQPWWHMARTRRKAFWMAWVYTALCLLAVVNAMYLSMRPAASLMNWVAVVVFFVFASLCWVNVSLRSRQEPTYADR
jgi:protein-S-isoprenylcysteine O-methyltransferase Ste14